MQDRGERESTVQYMDRLGMYSDIISPLLLQCFAVVFLSMLLPCYYYLVIYDSK